MTPEHKHVVGLDLLPCPFCGKEAELRQYDGEHFAQCLHCFCGTPADHGTEDEAVQAWNARAQPAPEPAQGEAAQSDKWLQDWARDKFTYTGKWRGSVYGSTDWAVARAMHASMMAEAKPDDELAAMRARFDQIEREIMANKHTAASVFTQMRTAALYIAPPLPGAELVELRALLAGTNYSASGDCHNARVVAAAIARIDAALARRKS